VGPSTSTTTGSRSRAAAAALPGTKGSHDSAPGNSQSASPALENYHVTDPMLPTHGHRLHHATERNGLQHKRGTLTWGGVVDEASPPLS
jgi:hypothetical protein